MGKTFRLNLLPLILRKKSQEAKFGDNQNPGGLYD